MGDRCFVYKPLTGIVLYFEVLRLTEPLGFCTGFEMATAQVKILKIFEPPITAKALKRSPEIRQEKFVTKNFQGKAFAIQENAARSILVLSGTPSRG